MKKTTMKARVRRAVSVLLVTAMALADAPPAAYAADEGAPAAKMQAAEETLEPAAEAEAAQEEALPEGPVVEGGPSEEVSEEGTVESEPPRETGTPSEASGKSGSSTEAEASIEEGTAQGTDMAETLTQEAGAMTEMSAGGVKILRAARRTALPG